MTRRSTSVLILLAAFWLVQTSLAFGIPQQRIAEATQLHSQQPDHTTVAENLGSQEEMASDSFLIDQVDRKILAGIEEELVQKYVTEGIPREDAERDVAVFLLDKKRADKYIEMRMYAAAQAEGTDASLALQLFGSFFVGFAVIAGPKYLAAFHQSSPDGLSSALF